MLIPYHPMSFFLLSQTCSYFLINFIFRLQDRFTSPNGDHFSHVNTSIKCLIDQLFSHVFLIFFLLFFLCLLLLYPSVSLLCIRLPPPPFPHRRKDIGDAVARKRVEFLFFPVSYLRSSFPLPLFHHFLLPLTTPFFPSSPMRRP